jgi:hypothetical protein
MRALRLFSISVCIVVAAGTAATSAWADDLVMPYACEMDHGAPRLVASEANVYHIFGPREEVAFSACGPSPAGTCETMMVHKFNIDCGGQRVAWAKVASAARALGVELPGHLPAGFAPVGRLQGRIVLPGFGRTTHLMTTVAMQTLSPDSVTEVSEPRAAAESAPWVTVVSSVTNVSASAEAFKVAGVISGLLATLMAGCIVVARRSPLLSFDLDRLPRVAAELGGRFRDLAMLTVTRIKIAFRHSYDSWKAADGDGGDANIASSLALVHARIAETEFLVATLPADLLLREVLQSELDNLRQRGAGLARRVRRLGPERASAAIRAMMRDLDRIARIVHGASQRSDYEEPASSDTPSSVFEAYRVLGLNPEAPYAAVKKVVDALRMSWHPDHARDEADRLYREQRIKQINAAWDILKSGGAAAA